MSTRSRQMRRQPSIAVQSKLADCSRITKASPERCNIGIEWHGTDTPQNGTEKTMPGTMRHRIEWHGTDTPQNGMSRCGVARRALVHAPKLLRGARGRIRRCGASHRPPASSPPADTCRGSHSARVPWPPCGSTFASQGMHPGCPSPPSSCGSARGCIYQGMCPSPPRSCGKAGASAHHPPGSTARALQPPSGPLSERDAAACCRSTS
mmetsp:Transcript_14788/g.37213  ORF Transcript_14788/g.37213 Transcript_14788/m.37213 type:complete len:208 (+) Transcript_14788:26-649(+)